MWWGLTCHAHLGALSLMVQGSQWYWNQSKWYRYACLINDGATSVNLLASGLSLFTGGAITLPHEVTIAQPEIPISDILYINTYLSVRNINGMLYLQAETDTGIYVNFYHGEGCECLRSRRNQALKKQREENIDRCRGGVYENKLCHVQGYR